MLQFWLVWSSRSFRQMWGAGSPWLQFDPHLNLLLLLLLLLALLDPGHLYQTLLQVMMKKMKELAIDIKLSHVCFILTFWAPIAFTNTVIQCWFSAPTFKLQGSPSQWYLTCFPWGQLRRRVDRVHLLTSVPPHSNFLLSTIFSSNALQSPPLPPPLDHQTLNLSVFPPIHALWMLKGFMIISYVSCCSSLINCDSFAEFAS